MSSESKRRPLPPSSSSRGTIVHSKFGRVVRALWPVKPALNLAQRAGISERGAQYIIDGKRKPNARVVHVLNAEILSD